MSWCKRATTFCAPGRKGSRALRVPCGFVTPDHQTWSTVRRARQQ